MKNYYQHISVITLLFFLSSCSQAQQIETEAVAKQVEALRLALIDPAEEKLKATTSAQLSYGHSSGKIEDQASFINSLVSGQSDFVSVDIKEQTIQVEGSTAIVRHLLEAVTNDAGKQGSVKLRVLLVFNRIGGEWKLLARQAIRTP